MKVGSLFTGIGGFDLGFERAGMMIAWQCEIDAKARSVLAHHWPAVPCYEDVQNVDSTAPAVDVLCGGFPCQDLSVAGKRAGLAGERSGLFFEFARVIEQVAPRVVVIENVPGLLSSNAGRDMATVVGALGQLGYGWAYRVLDAQYDGLAQRRERVFIVGCAGGDTGRAASVLFEPESVRRDSPPSRATREDLAGTLGDRSARSHTELDGHGAYVVADTLGTSADRVTGAFGQLAPSLTGNPHYRSHPGSDPIIVSDTLRGSHNPGATDAIVFDRAQITSSANRSQPEPGKPAPTLHGDPVMVAYTDRVAGTVGARDFKGAGSYRDGGIQNCAMVHGRVRRLMPVEYARLQGFPDDWNDWLPDSSRYKQFGNAVAVPVAEWIGRRIMEVLQ